MTVIRVIAVDGDETNQFLTTIAGHKPGDVACVWFDGSEKKEGVFTPEALEPVE